MTRYTITRNGRVWSYAAAVSLVFAASTVSVITQAVGA